MKLLDLEIRPIYKSHVNLLNI